VNLSKTSEGILYSRIGTLLSGIGLLAIFVYQMLYNYVIQYGGTYPSGGILLISWPLLAFGAVFGLYGARMLRSRIALAVPIASSITLFTFFIQWEWCLRYCVRP
jgi:hypothetical protein